MASLPVQLFFWPGSFFSQKAQLALEEKNVRYKQTVICLPEHQQTEPWYLRLNPKGQVPMLKLGDKFVTESENVIDTVDKLNNAPVLVPDPSTPEGKLVQEWRSKFNSLNVEGLTFGVLLHPELAVGEIKMPAMYRQTKEGYEAKAKKAVARMEALRDKNPDLREAYDDKIEKFRNKPSIMLDKNYIAKLIDDLEPLFDELEAQLRKSRTENIIQHWLCGPNFTAADITLCILLGRLINVGLIQRFLIAEKRPALIEYWNQAQQRGTIQKVVLGAKKGLMVYLAKKAITKVATGAVVAGGVVALGIFLGQKYKS
ncbi:ganglioside-induced differentiation-associated protein 1-like [Physella acuta]|uniref:ganglioside-induced differentiation-associated protein 1-like n=1 Tax=Physella acuta TaxID=109671 RepID=UPI0027DC2B3B|nr:ganglioside-induced differentiation-associated protein 1-like [Physella acuta]XP_059170203.1 ganglioside-induced differentiation-associated protein 1-like [Physella acuta]